MRPDSPLLTRRAVLQGAAAAALAGTVAPAFAQKAPAAVRPWRVTQLLDTSAEQQELSRDYSTGLRLAFAEQSRMGQRLPELVSVETDGTPASVEAALRAVQADASQVALLGAAGERVAIESVTAARRIGLDIAHLAPWLADTRFDGDDQVYPLFASRDAQIRHALRSLAATGVSELGLVYPTPALQRQLHAGIVAATAPLKLKLAVHTVPAGGDVAAFAEGLPSSLPAVLLFPGGTVELALFSRGLARRGLHRYVIGLADVDITALQQLGPGKGVPLIFTQVVPNPQSSALPVVRQYREALKAYYDEAPSPVSLAGYVAGRYAAQLLGRGSARGAVLADAMRRAEVDLGGVSIDFARYRRGSAFVNQIMLQGNGRLIG